MAGAVLTLKGYSGDSVWQFCKDAGKKVVESSKHGSSSKNVGFYFSHDAINIFSLDLLNLINAHVFYNADLL